MKTLDREYEIGETKFAPRVYRCHLAIIHDGDDSWSAIVLNLPGGGGCGDSEAGSVEDAKQSVIGLVESYTESEVDVPWVDSTTESVEIPDGAKLKWVLVYV